MVVGRGSLGGESVRVGILAAVRKLVSAVAVIAASCNVIGYLWGRGHCHCGAVEMAPLSFGDDAADGVVCLLLGVLVALFAA